MSRIASACRALAGRALVTTCPGSLPHVATSLRCRDIKATRIKSRHIFEVATPFLLPSPSQVATSFSGRDLLDDQAYVATSSSCRDLAPAHSGISRSRHQNPRRDLPHCRLCRDIKFMSRLQVSSAPFLLRRDAVFRVATWGFSLLVTTGITFVTTQAHPACLASPGRDLLVRLRPKTKNGQ